MMKLHALLIGISHYPKNDVCASLEGAVADVEAMAAYLRAHEVPAERIRKLTVSNRAEGPPPEPRDAWPTYENMVAAIQQLTEEAEPGKHVLIYYAGHGGRVTPSLIPGSKTIDEGLIPPDIGNPGARYLRDVELTYLLHLMAEKKLKVTLILDACHSAGIFRGSGRVAPKLIRRGSRGVDDRTATPASLVASPDELKAVWQKVHNRAYVATRGRSLSGWLAAAEGSVLLAACRSVESAYEYPFAGRSRGLLTYCLLEILAEGWRDLSFEQIRNRLVSRVHHYAPTQTPVLEGDASRRVFGGHLRSLREAIEVRDVELGAGRVRLGAGQAVGLAEGALLRILPGTEDLQDSQRRPVVKIAEVAAFESWGYTTGESGEAKVRPGDRAILIDPGDHVRRRVALIPPERDRVEKTARAAGMLDAIRHELKRRASGFLHLVGDADPSTGVPPDFQVAVKQDDGRGRATAARPCEVEICHADGGEIADLPLLPVTDPRAAGRIADSLVQLARFHNVRDLENRDQSSPLHGALTAELGLLPEDFAPGHDVEPQPFASQDPIPGVEIGRWICLTVANHSPQALEITVLDLQPGWTIEQIHPLSGAETLDGDTAVRLPFQIYLPSGFRNRREILKVFGTADPADFRWLQLSAIGTPEHSVPRTRGTRSDPLARLFVEIAQDGPRTRSPETRYASRFWTSAQVELEVL